MRMIEIREEEKWVKIKERNNRTGREKKKKVKVEKGRHNDRKGGDGKGREERKVSKIFGKVFKSPYLASY